MDKLSAKSGLIIQFQFMVIFVLIVAGLIFLNNKIDKQLERADLLKDKFYEELNKMRSSR